jgi:hypothetical protein
MSRAESRVSCLDVDTHRAHLTRTGETLHVYLNGEDVTRYAFRAVFHNDGINGTVWSYRRDERGSHFLDPETGKVATEMRSGRLLITPGEPFA